MAKDVVDILYDACEDDELPLDQACLKAFLFDRCDDWNDLCGLYQGMTNVISTCLEKDSKDKLRQAVKDNTVLQCIEDAYADCFAVSKTSRSGYWDWYKEHRTTLRARVSAKVASLYACVYLITSHQQLYSIHTLMTNAGGFFQCDIMI